MELDQFKVELTTAAGTVHSGIAVHPNLSFAKCRNVPERSIRELRKFAKQARQREIITSPQLALTMDIISGVMNNTPISRNSTVCPANFLNPGMKPADLSLPEAITDLPYVKRMDAYIKTFKIIHVEALEASLKLITSMSGNGPPGVKMGDIIFFLKNEDAPEKGIVYAEILERLNSDYRVRVLGGAEKTIPYQRIRMFVPADGGFMESVGELTKEERGLSDRLGEALHRLKSRK